MCGRFSLTLDPNQLRQEFAWLNIPVDTAPRYNVAPSQPVAVVPNDGRKQIDYFLWGLIPSWSMDASIGYRMINARSETAAEKPSFRAAFRRRRCLIPADGFYEWRKEDDKKRKTPYYVFLKSMKPFFFAGLWESWASPDGSNILSCTILTTQPNDLVAQIHDRMPVILTPEYYDYWLNPNELKPSDLEGVLKAYPADQMSAYPVSTIVNNPANDSIECIKPI
jgi:putative SOS response-associated peptidase YedK